MGEIVTTLYSAFSEVVPALARGMKNAFSEILWQDPEATTRVLSDPVQFALVCAGIGLASGLVIGAFRWIRARRG